MTESPYQGVQSKESNRCEVQTKNLARDPPPTVIHTLTLTIRDGPLHTIVDCAYYKVQLSKTPGISTLPPSDVLHFIWTSISARFKNGQKNTS